MEATPLSSLLVRVRRALALNFPSPVWVRAEIAQINERRGHRYLQFVEKGEADSPIAKVDGAVWSRTYSSVLKQRGSSAAEVLVAGQEVCALVNLDFHEVFGLKLEILDWDPSFTLGQLELKRRAIVEELRSENLIEVNSRLMLPPVVQRIAVLTSSAAAGYADFLAQLDRNPYGYYFETTLFDVSVQGEHVGASVSEALAIVSQKAGEFDAIAILRGGGSKLDLAGFDRIEIGRAIAASSLPVLVGIGHEIDETLPDLLAHTSLKTPTALAEFIIGRSANFEAQQLEYGRTIARYAGQHLQVESNRLQSTGSTLGYSAMSTLDREVALLLEAQGVVATHTRFTLTLSETQLDNLAIQLENLDPNTILQRGYAMVSRKGIRIRSAAEVNPGDRIVTHFENDSLESLVQ